MAESIYQYLAADHDRLDGLLDRATTVSGVIDMVSYDAFRGGILRHIAMEERTVFPAIVQFQKGRKAAVVERLRLDHGALAALLTPPPDSAIITTIRSILSVHNALEERDGGAYRLLEQLAGVELERLLKKLRATPEVPLAPYNERPGVLEATRRAVARAGYELL